MTDPAPETQPRFIARQLALGFSVVSIVSIAMCGMLLAIINDVSQLVSGMRHDEHVIRDGLDLATAVREQTLQAQQALLAGPTADVAAYERFRGQVRAGIQTLSSAVPRAERQRLQALGEKTQQMHERFVAVAMPAARREDSSVLREEQQHLARLAREASEHADAISRAIESRMTHAHVLATDATHLGLVGGGACVLLVLGLSFGFTLRLRRAVLSPLRELSEAARRIGRGELDIRVGDVGRGELLELSHAFDRMANELRAREERLVQSERMAAIGQLAAGVAHELNNPIGIIRGYLKTMTPDADPETLREELAILDEEAAQCQRIAEDLLAYARTSELTLASLELRPFLEETLRRFHESPVGQRVTLDVDVQEARLEADASRLRQVVLNLLTNAAQACPEGARTLLRGRREGEMCVIDVDDEGPGIAVEDRARVFEPFYSKRPGGTGLGLAVCAGIVEAHHGTIRVEDKDGQGARFRLRLPLTQAEASSFPKARP